MKKNKVHSDDKNTIGEENDDDRKSIFSLANPGMGSQAASTTLNNTQPTHIPVSKSGCQRLLPPILRMKFADEELENLYQSYRTRIKRESIMSFIFFSILFDIHAIILSCMNYSALKLPSLITSCIHMFIVAMVLIIHKAKKLPDGLYTVLPYMVWILFCLELFCEVIFNTLVVTPRDALAWQIVLIYGTFVMLPLQLLTCLLLVAVSSATHLTMLILIPVGKGYDNIFDMANVIAANCLLYLIAMLLGLSTYLIVDSGIRNSFLRTKQSLSFYIEMEEGSKQQESLLLSVLPKHVAAEMVRDLGKDVTGQFRKIYMNRHEDVSILFADIVGFTALSSKVTASELIVILNDLFASFDKLANKYHQMRIKILGDCYYCICGCPDARPDHAVLSIHMGLSMVEEIKLVQQKTASDVNMRVGIHTGPVLGGVLGQVRWQYDVLGKDVTLANKMESGGLPGRVHISSNTTKFLQGQFDLEPGDGASREEGIKEANLETYFIKGVRKPYPQGTLDDVQPNTKVKKTKKKKRKAIRENETIHENMTYIGTVEENDDQSNQTMRLYHALMDRENNTLMSKKLGKFTMMFLDEKLEVLYTRQRQVIGGHTMLLAVGVAVFTSIAHLCVLPSDILSIVSFVIGTTLLVMMMLISLPVACKKSCPIQLKLLSSRIEKNRFGLLAWILTTITLLSVINFIQIVTCDQSENGTFAQHFRYDVSNSSNRHLKAGSSECHYPTYYLDSAVVVMLLTIVTPLSFIVKNTISCLICIICCLIANVSHPQLFDFYDSVVFDSVIDHDGFVSTKISMTITIVCITFFLLNFSRYFDRLSRKLFYYHHEVQEMQEKLEDMRHKNQQLIYNILPAHIAKDFIGATKSDEELYSQSYDCVGVMFAACPNFNDFYTEDAVNNNGLECFRVLNEILSDYDELLNEKRFQSIVKIKTIGPTLMAASGMAPGVFSNVCKKTTDKWEHLKDLVDFAFALKECLHKINTQSFNNFMLRIGINQGPILAGVIGAKKPHYDIWGNTVNVASRMESTSQLGKIQVVEDTMIVLKNFGYTFEQRGHIMVKGKGNLMTYYLTGRGNPGNQLLLPNQME